MPSSRALLDAAVLQKALSPLQQQQHEISDQLIALNSRLSTLQSDLSRYCLSGGLRGAAGVLSANDIVLVAAVLLLQLLMLWWLVRPSVVAAEQPAHAH